MQTTSTDSTAPRGNYEDSNYDAFLIRIQRRFLANIEEGKEPLFTTDVDESALWEAYLSAFPLGTQRQYHNCTACRHFIQRYGALVTISGAVAKSSIWDPDDAPPEYKPAIQLMARLVRRARVTGVFLSSLTMWGQPVTGPWHHFAVAPPLSMVFNRATLTAGQAMAEKAEDFKNVSRALAEFPAAAVNQALGLLKSDALYRSEKVLGQAQWLSDLHAAIEVSNGQRANVIWRFVALAPAGFCHPRSSMIGTLLEDIIAGVPFEDASRKFRDKMAPDRYQRPQAAPSAGAIAQAEKVVAELGAAGALARRYARLEELQLVWQPAPAAEPKPNGNGASVFGHLVPKGAAAPPEMTAPPVAMTWEKFVRTVLPEAKAIEALVPNHGHFCAYLTAVNPEAPPILQWDLLDRRNPVSLYVWTNGSPASQWGLVAGTWKKVNGISLLPSMWNGGFEHHGSGALFVLDGAKDSRSEGAGSALFPEMLKSEFHGVRSVIEAFSQRAKLEGIAEASACGVLFGKNAAVVVRVVDAKGARSAYKLDRWD